MRCNICADQTDDIFSQKILSKYECQYYYCTQCGFLQTEKPYWLKESYSDAIADADTGLVQRNIDISRRLAVLLYFLFGNEGSYVDVAGGTGLLVRMMRDIGFDFYWKDPYCTNVHARHFEFQEGKGKSNAVTVFEVLEHLEDPVVFIKDALAQAEATTFIFTTELFHSRPPLPGNWWYYTPETGQHIAFYQNKTLVKIAAELNLTYYSFGGLHVMTDRSRLSAWFKLIVGQGARFAFSYVKRHTRSKTMDDHRAILGSEN